MNRHVSRRSFLSLVAAPLAASPSNRPNVVFLYADQLRYQSCGYAGDGHATTPNIDRLAAEGMSFSNAVSSMPVCAAYRASLFTGKYVTSTGMVINEMRINPNHRALGHVVHDAGYETSYIGKWHLWANQAGNHTDPRNSYFPADMQRYKLGWEHGEWKAFNFNHRYYQGFIVGDKPEKTMLDGYEPDIQTDWAIDFIRRSAGRDRPFYLTLSYGPPHDPWRRDNAPERFIRMHERTRFGLPENWRDTPDPYMDRHTDPKRWRHYWKPSIPDFTRVYYAQTTSMDWNIGRILDALDETGAADNTIVVFTSDHGEMMGAQGRVQKLTFYEEACRVPFVVRWPGHVRAGKVSDACLGTPDIAPTLLGLMGLEAPQEMEGMDLSHLALGRNGAEPEAALLQGMGHTYRWIDGSEWRGVRDKRYTYATYLRDGSELFFDNEADPLQQTNLVTDAGHRRHRERLKEWMHAKMVELNDGFHPCAWYQRWTDGKRNIVRTATADWTSEGWAL